MLNPKLRSDLIPGDRYTHRFADGTTTEVTVISASEEMDPDRFGNRVWGYVAEADGRRGLEMYQAGAVVDLLP